ncbi:alpha-ribazole-5'-phosphate phosphatase [Alcanivorax nanhaiticus]|uniref:phosphoglycerate mutase (2,3-diphosphoglycerate-dependent) n=1 Tax=Alcanivorax nanhaiticus TaxID=1177154 RepID=A0A095TMD1_9GAMM|nr:histidine phosphatase family protein [Alcanivorax nanhaiticus]KGD63573.1 alpha-ribazole-5'-phosphate phosphatase [Alcanivorax nanhaiticus]
MTTTFFDLIRHGEPAGGHKYRGHRDDPLSELGWQQMRDAIGKDEEWDHILTSPLLRCREFASELSAQLKVPVTVAEGFKEICFGDWEGKTREQVAQEYGDHQANFWRDAENYPPPNAETVQDFYQRIGTAWQHWSQELAGQKVLLVCHGGVIRMVLGHVLGLTPSNAMAGFHVPFANRSQVRLDQTEFGTLSCLVSHG